MKVGIDCRPAQYYKGTGIGTYTLELIKNLYTLKKDQLSYLGCTENDNSILSLSIKEILSCSKKANDFWQEMLDPPYSRLDYIDTLHIPQNGMGIPKHQDLNIISTIHDVIPLRLASTCSPRFLKLFEENIFNIAEKSSLILTVSDFSKSDICSCLDVDESKVIVTHLAASKIYKPYDKLYSKQIIKTKLNVESPYILFVGGYTPRKNLKGLIESFSLLSDKLKNIYKLVIVAKRGISYDSTVDWASKKGVLDKCIFIDYVDEITMPFVYNAASLFVFPSFYEGFGLPVLEAMSCGTPVITSNTTSIPEVVGNSAILIDPRDTIALSKKIQETLEASELQQKLSREGIIRAKQFSWKTTAKKTLEAYSLLSKI